MRFLAKVHVTLKKSVLDPQGVAVKNALGSLGFKGIDSVRLGKLIEIRLEAKDAKAAKAQVEAMSKKLLANVVIESFDVEIERA
jgi:phosphoribosylformylglycinamidine synthase PurS subunit